MCKNLREKKLRTSILLLGFGFAAAVFGTALGSSQPAQAQSYQRQQFHWPWERPRYRSAPQRRPAQTRRPEPSYRTEPAQRAEPAQASEPAYTSEPTIRTEQVIRSEPASQPGLTYRSLPMPSSSQSRQVTQPAPVNRTAQPAPAAQTARSAAAAPPQAAASAQARASAEQNSMACINDKGSFPPDAAIKHCDAVIQDTIRNLATAYYFKGVASYRKDDYDGALANYAQAIRLDPYASDYLNARATVYEAKQDFARAMADYNHAIKLDPKSVKAYKSRGAAYQRKGDYARASADYGEVTRLQPDNIDAWSARCWVRAISPHETRQALSDCNHALKIKADAPDVLDTRGFVHLKLGQTDNAIRDFDAALKIDPKLAGSLYGRGLARLKKGDRTGGSADIAAARALKGDIAEEFARYGVR